MKCPLRSATFLACILALSLTGALLSAQPFDFAVIVTTDTQIPGAPAGTTFSNIPLPGVRGGHVVFRGEGPGTEGIYAFRGGELEMLVDKNTAVPDDPGASNFVDFIKTPALDESFNVAFLGEGESGVKGIYTIIDGQVEMIADSNTRIPGTGNLDTFSDFSNPWIADGNIVFRATGPGIDGIYTNLGGSLRKVAATDNGVVSGTNIPDGVGEFTGFGQFVSGPAQAPSIGGNSIAFYGEGSGGQQGIYAEINGTLIRIADTNTLIPGGGGATFPGFDVNVSLSAATYDGGVVFVAGLDSNPPPQSLGIYKWWSGSLMKIADQSSVVVGEGGNLTSFGEGQGLSFYKDEYSFLGDGNTLGGGTFSPQGIYAILNGQIVKVLANGDLLEGESVGSMGSYGQGIENGSMVFNIGAWGNKTANVAAIQEHRWLGAGSTIYGEPGSGSDWDDKANWPFGLLPRAVVPTVIDPGGDVTVHGPHSDVTLHSLHVGGGAGIATFWMHGGAVLNVPTTTIASTGEVVGNGSFAGTLVNNGLIRPDNVSATILQNNGVTELSEPDSRFTGINEIINDGAIIGEGHLMAQLLTNNGLIDARRITIQGACLDNYGELVLSRTDAVIVGADELHNYGTIRGSGRIEVHIFNIEAGGEVRIGQGERLAFTINEWSNAGLLEVRGGEFESNDTVFNFGSAMIAGRDATFRFGPGLVNGGAFAISFGTSDIFGDVANNASGTIVLSGNSNTTFYDDVINDGTFQVSSGSTVVFFGDYSGDNGIAGSGMVFMEGDLRPGNSPAEISFGGDLHFGALASLEVELGGTLAGSEYDRVAVSDVVTLAGELDVSLINGFIPTAGDTFEILTAASIVGTLTPGTLTTLPGSLQWFVNYNSTSVSLVSTFAGDFDFDGDVDGRDFLVWQRDPGVGDLADWQANYGMVVPLAGASTAVPEPGTFLLLLGMKALFPAFRRT